MTTFVPSCGTLLYLTMSVSAVIAQPQVNAATNAADYTPTLAPGSIAAVFGTDLAPAPEYPSGLPLPPTLNSVSVTINGKAAPLFYISALQINFQVPFETESSIEICAVPVTTGSTVLTGTIGLSALEPAEAELPVFDAVTTARM